MKTKSILNTAIKDMKEAVESLEGMGCTFWACDGTPENNRIVSMKTCSRCQAIINTNRSIKKLEKACNML